MVRCIATIECSELDIPFRHVFSHSSATRDKAATLWVKVTDVEGVIGHGEGCPREYVTGETVTGAMEFIERHRTSVVAAVTDLDSLKEWMSQHAEEISHNPAGWCALELALLDMLARRASMPVDDLLELPRLGQSFSYSAVIGVTSADQCAALVAQYQQLGMTDYKIKLSGDLNVDSDNLAVLRAVQPQRVRVDANNLWSDLAVAYDYLLSLDYSFFAIEEPFEAERFDLMLALGTALDTQIILDESVLRVGQLELISSHPERWIVNVRISKMGGLQRSLDFIDQCRTRGIAVIIGAQVGETSLLTRAALTLANVAQDILVAQEGAFGTYLLEIDPCEPELRFAKNGILDCGCYNLAKKSGFGLDIRKYLGVGN